MWTLAVAAVAGAALGVIVGWLIPRATASASATPTTQTSDQVTPAAPAEEARAAAEESAGPAEVPRIGMEDVVTELERRYQGRRADEERERARRKRDGEAPPP